LVVSCGQGNGGPAASVPEELSPLEAARNLAVINSRQDAPLADTSAYPEEIQAILNRGSVIFAMTAADQKPFFYREETTGELAGLDVELAYEIANRLGVRAVFNRDAVSFDEVVRQVLDRKADIALSKLSRTLPRAELVRYTTPYIVFRQALLVNRLEFAKIGTEDQLPSYIKNFTGRLGVIKNSSYANYAAANFPSAIIESFDTWDETVDALFAGKVLAVYRDEGEILIVNATRKDAAILMKTVFINDQQDPIAMAVAPDAPLLQEWLNVFLEEYLRQKNGEFAIARIVQRHFSAAKSAANP
jgi:ABC-type amino acid transport substrate-binding protein